MYTRVFHLWKSIDLDSAQSRRDRATCNVILINFGSISRNLGDISESQGLWANSRRLCFSVNRREEIFLNAWLWPVWPKYSYLLTRKSPRPGCAQRHFDQLWVDFQELGRYFRVPGILNYFEKTLFFSEMDKGKIFERLVMSCLAEI